MSGGTPREAPRRHSIAGRKSRFTRCRRSNQDFRPSATFESVPRRIPRLLLRGGRGGHKFEKVTVGIGPEQTPGREWMIGATVFRVSRTVAKEDALLTQSNQYLVERRIVHDERQMLARHF